MAKSKTFESMATEYQTQLNKAFYGLTMARTREEVEVANIEVHKVVSKYARELKTFLDDLMLKAISDHANMQKLLQDRFNLAPDRAQLSFDIKRNTIKWTISLFDGKEKYWYLSKRDRGVDLDNFYAFCQNMLT